MENQIKGEFLDFSKLNEKDKITLIMPANQMRKILNVIGNDIDRKGFVLDTKTNEKVLTPEFEEIKLKNVGAVLKGSKVFIKKNVASFAQYLIKQEKR